MTLDSCYDRIQSFGSWQILGLVLVARVRYQALRQVLQASVRKGFVTCPITLGSSQLEFLGVARQQVLLLLRRLVDKVGFDSSCHVRNQSVRNPVIQNRLLQPGTLSPCVGSVILKQRFQIADDRTVGNIASSQFP